MDLWNRFENEDGQKSYFCGELPLLWHASAEW